jgi:NAD(P)-dependent dehydrogenase (short-subunit alcohol dehydrogenase family)
MQAQPGYDPLPQSTSETPGLVDLAGSDAEQQKGPLNYLASTVPMGRVGTAEEIAESVLHLASDQSSYVSGIELAVDGGQAQV